MKDKKQFSATWIDLRSTMLSQREKDRHKIISQMWDMKKQNSVITNVQIQGKQKT